MEYLQPAVAETLRMYPSVPREFRTVLEDGSLPDGTRIRKGDFVSFLSYVMGRSCAMWGDDAEVFRPERHLAVVEGEWGKLRRVFKPPTRSSSPRSSLGRGRAWASSSHT